MTFLEWYRIKNNNKKDQSLPKKKLTKDSAVVHAGHYYVKPLKVMYFYVFPWCNNGFYCSVCSLEPRTAQYLFSSLHVCQDLCSVPVTCSPPCPPGRWESPHLQPGMELCRCGQGQDQAAHPELHKGAHVDPNGFRGEMCYLGTERAPKLSSPSDFHPQHPGLESPSDATHSPVFALAWVPGAGQGGRALWQCPAARGGHPAGQTSAVCAREHPLQQHARSCGWDSLQGRAPRSNTPTPSTGRTGSRRSWNQNSHGFFGFFPYFYVLSSLKFCGVFGWSGVFCFGLVFESQIKLRSLLLSLTFSSHPCLLKISLICC